MTAPASPGFRPEARAAAPGGWARAHAAGLATLALGLLTFVLVAVLQRDHLWQTPDLRLALPLLGATVAGAVASLLRRERLPALPLAGVGLAAAAMVLGYVVVLGAVVLVTTLVIVILHGVM